LRHLYRLYPVVLLSLLTFPVLAQTTSPAQALLEDATEYAQQTGVSVDEATRRIAIERAAGELDSVLATEESATFAGLWIQDKPSYRVIVRFTDAAAEGRLQARIAGGPLEGLVDVRPARFSLAQLEAKQKETRRNTERAKVQQNSDINVFENKVEVHTLDPDKLKAKLASVNAKIPDGVELKRVPRLATAEVAIYGGVGLSTCTAGYNVRSGSGELGISTAAHCGNTQYYQGVQLPFRGEDNNGDQDVQWHSACDLFDVTNEFQSGIGLRAVTGTVARSSQAIGSMVCKYGMTTGRTCGYIQSKSIDLGPNHNGTFIRVDSRSAYNNLSEPGDSGGPWFVEDKAYGTHFGAPGDDANDSIYMAINYISSLGVSVLTYNPGACALPPSAWLMYDRPYNDTYVTFDASYSSDPDGYIVSYHWDFGDGYSTTTSVPYTDHNYWQPGSYNVTLTVTDNEGLTGQDYRFVSVCNPGTDLCVQ
jgi:hypothetical protein